MDQLFSWGLNIEAFMQCRYLSINCRYLTYHRKIDMVWSGCVQNESIPQVANFIGHCILPNFKKPFVWESYHWRQGQRIVYARVGTNQYANPY